MEKDNQYLREIAIVEMLYDPMFVPDNPCQDCDPEKVRSMLSIWQKFTRTAPERYTGTLAAMLDRYEDQQRPPVFELIITLQNFEQKFPPSHASISWVCAGASA